VPQLSFRSLLLQELLLTGTHYQTLYHLVGFSIILKKHAAVCYIMPVGVHTPLPKYPSGDWQLLSRSRSRYANTKDINVQCTHMVASVMTWTVMTSVATPRPSRLSDTITSHNIWLQENSAKLTNQRVSCAFTSSPFSFHVRHILPTSKFKNSYSCILLIFLQTSVNNVCHHDVWELRLWVWIQYTGLTLPVQEAGTPANNSIILISPVQSLGYIFAAGSIMRSSANFRTVFCESQNDNPLDAEL